MNRQSTMRFFGVGKRILGVVMALGLTVALTSLSPVANAAVTGSLRILGETEIADLSQDGSGDGWSWNASTDTLTLDGYNGGGFNFDVADDDTIKVLLAGDSTIETTGWGDPSVGLFSGGSLEIDNEGAEIHSLTINTYDFFAIGALINLNIKGGNVVANAGEEGIQTWFGVVEISGGTVTVTSEGFYGVASGINLYPGETKIYDVEAGVIISGNGTLVATGERGGIAAFHSDVASDVTINTTGSVTATATGANGSGIEAEGSVNIASGTVTATATGTGYAISATGTVEISGGNVTLNAADSNRYSDPDYTLNGGSVNGIYPPSDKTELESVVAVVQALDQGRYTTSSWATVASALAEAQLVVDDLAAQQDATDAAADVLNDAVADLVLRGDATVLQTFVNVADVLTDKLGGYTDESVSALTVALDAAKADLAAADDRSQGQFTASETAILNALSGLTVKPAVVDKSVLQHVHDGVKTLSNTDKKYTDVSWTKLQDELADVKAVLDNPSASQAQIDAAAKELSAAVADLKYVPAPPVPVVVDLAAATVEQIADTAYTGNAITPKVLVTHAGKTLKEGEHFTVAHKDNTKIGLASITLKAAGNHKGSKTVSYKIVPKENSVSKATAGKKKVKVTWKKVSAAQKVSKYQVRYQVAGTSTWKTKTVSSAKKSLTIKKLKKGKVYEFQVRSYKKISSGASKGTYYSAWSDTKISKKVK